LRRTTENGLTLYRFEGLEALGLNHAVFTREGGHSEAPFESLNLSFAVGDDPERVRANRKAVARVLGVEGLASAHQVHGTNCAVATEARGNESAGEADERADVILCDRPGLGVMIKQADCQAVILFEPEAHALAIVHSGWRGSVANVLGQAVGRMQALFGARPEAMRAAIAPSLGPCCAEFRDWRTLLPAGFAAYRRGEDHFDFWAISAHQLQAAGLKPRHIEQPGICTRCSKEFYSYRREGVTGRFATVGAL
jgi:YfiH family protein